MEDITKQEYSTWLEESLKTVLEFKPSSICIVATAEDGTTKTGYGYIRRDCLDLHIR